MEKTGIFRKGLPLEPDLQRLDERYPKSLLVPGFKIPYEEIAQVISCPVGSSRFATVTSAWRKRAEKQWNVIIGCLPKEAFVVLDGKQKVNLADDKLRSAGRMARRSLVISSRIMPSEIDEDGRKRLDFNARRASSILGTLAIKRPQELPAL